MNILITGYHGFVAQNLLPYLHERGHHLYGLGRSKADNPLLSGCFTWDELDDPQSPLQKTHFDAVVHLAGKAHDTKNQTEAEVYFQVNRDLAVKMFSYFMSHHEQAKFIFFSSVKAAADKVVTDKLTEDVNPTPKGPYGESKQEAEVKLQEMAKGLEDHRRLYILRPCMMHGPGNKGNLNLLYKVVRTGLPWPLGAFENRRSFAAIGNVCYVVNRLLEEDVPGGIYNLADDEALSTNQLIEVICSALGKKAHIWRFGRGAMTAMARLGDRLHLPLNTERLAKLTENYVVDNSKIKQALNLEAMPINTREGLTTTIKSFDK